MFLKRCAIFVMAFFSITIAAYAEMKVNGSPYELGTFPVLKVLDNSIYLAYYGEGKENPLYIKRIGDADGEAEVKAKNAKGTYIVLDSLKDRLLVTWRPKDGEGKKYVYVQASDDKGKTFGGPIIANSTTDALPPIATATDGADRFYVVWVDEREAIHRLYMNYSTDGGRRFQGKDILLTPDFTGANQPKLIVEKDRIDLFFTGKRVGEKTHGIYHMRSDDGGRTWSKITAVWMLEGWSPYKIDPVKTGDRMLIFWAGVEGLHGACSYDGEKWEKIDFKETAGKDIYRFTTAVHRNNVYIAASWKTRLAMDEKPNVYFYKSEDGGLTWAGPVKLNRNKFNSTSSVFPAIGLSSDGRTILVAWQDHRNIRGSIYANYSEDGGKTWLSEDIPIEKEPGKYNNSDPYIVEHGGKFYILWVRFRDDLKAEADLFMEEVRITGRAAPIGGKGMGEDGKEKLLRQRVAENWQAMLNHDRGKVYDMFDPFFKGRASKEWFVGLQSPVKYEGFQVASVTLEGNVATVVVKVKYSIRHMSKLGQKIEELDREKDVVDKWLFIENNWYRQFFDAITEGTFALY